MCLGSFSNMWPGGGRYGAFIQTSLFSSQARPLVFHPSAGEVPYSRLYHGVSRSANLSLTSPWPEREGCPDGDLRSSWLPGRGGFSASRPGLVPHPVSGTMPTTRERVGYTLSLAEISHVDPKKKKRKRKSRIRLCTDQLCAPVKMFRTTCVRKGLLKIAKNSAGIYYNGIGISNYLVS